MSKATNGATPPNPLLDTLMLPLSPGVSMISIPLETDSQMLSDLLPNLPAGSRVWTWDAEDQQFVEGFEQTLAFGQGAFLYLPSPAMITITGTPAQSDQVPVELAAGWNLVGVPYDAELPRAAQTVTENLVDTPFNDAVNDGVILDMVYSLDIKGYQEVGPDDSFQSTHAYWLYSNDQSLLKMGPVAPPLLQIAPTPGLWLAEKIGGAAANWAIGQLLTSLEPSQPDPFDVVNAKLDAIGNQLSDIQRTQTQILDAVNELSTLITDKTTQNLIETQQIRVLNVQTQLTTHFDDTEDATSFGYFQQKAAAHTPASQAELTEFAWNVLYKWKFPALYNDINTAINGAGVNGGILDQYGNFAVNASSAGTLTQRYQLLQDYFNYLIGLQTKCAALITNSYNVLATVPPYNNTAPPGANQGENWRKDAYAKKILPELERFRIVVESIAARRVNLTRNEQPIVIPVEVQQIFTAADLVIMNIAAEPQGLRIHVLTNPGSLTNAYLTLATAYNGTSNEINNVGCSAASSPRCPAGTDWRTFTGPSPYDDWSLNLSGQTIRQLSLTNDWKLGRIIVPMTYADFGGQQRFTATVGLRSFPNQWTDRNDNTTVMYFDPTGRPAASGTILGSIIVANRPMAKTVLDGCSWRNQVTTTQKNYGDSRNRMTFTCNQADVAGCNAEGKAANCAWTTLSVPFVYVGPTPAVAEFVAHTESWVDGPCAVSLNNVHVTDYVTGQLVLASPYQEANSLSGLITFTPQRIYALRLTNIATAAANARGCGTHVKYKDSFVFGR